MFKPEVNRHPCKLLPRLTAGSHVAPLLAMKAFAVTVSAGQEEVSAREAEASSIPF
jgi:hypothetical protein